MRRMHQLTVAALLLAGGLVPARAASAGPLASWFGCGDCPPPSYSPFRYWTPALARLHDCFHGPSLSMYAPERHPEVPPSAYILQYPCPPVPPAETLIPTPTPPETSRFQYLGAARR
jgi:hypothetical protein